MPVTANDDFMESVMLAGISINDFYSSSRSCPMKSKQPASHQERLETFARALARIMRRLKKQRKRQPPVEKKPAGESPSP
jgi:hypothetical protein